MTKAEYLKKYKKAYASPYYEGLDMYDFAYMASHVSDDEELVELAKTCVISTEDFQFYLEECFNDIGGDSGFTE